MAYEFGERPPLNYIGPDQPNRTRMDTGHKGSTSNPLGGYVGFNTDSPPHISSFHNLLPDRSDAEEEEEGLVPELSLIPPDPTEDMGKILHMGNSTPIETTSDILSTPEKEERWQVEKITTFDSKSLCDIVNAMYGPKEWNSKDPRYWANMKDWTVTGRPTDEEKESWPDATKRTYDHLKTILKWSSDDEARRHLDPAPGVETYDEKGDIVETRVPDWDDPEDVDMAIAHLARYYFNSGEPEKITPLLALNKQNELLGAVTLRWRGDKYVPADQQIAAVERTIVNTAPEFKRKGIGTKLIASALQVAFELKKPYRNRQGKPQGAKEVRAWVMADHLAGGYHVNLNLFRINLGFDNIRSNDGRWSSFAKKRGIQTDREADWLKIDKEKWESRQHLPKMQPCGKIDLDQTA